MDMELQHELECINENLNCIVKNQLILWNKIENIEKLLEDGPKSSAIAAKLPCEKA